MYKRINAIKPISKLIKLIGIVAITILYFPKTLSKPKIPPLIFPAS